MDKVRVMRLYLACFMVFMAFVAYMSFTQPIKTAVPDEQERLYTEVPKAIKGKASPVDKGDAVLYMEIPRFGKDWFWTVSEGTSLDILDNGPGHYVGTPLPGEKGNSSYAAHRSTHGDPFIDFDLLEPGDTVTLSQDGAEWTYEVTMEPVIIEPDEGWVVKNMQHGHWLTLTTCWPKYGSEKRMYVRAKLTDTDVS